MTSRRTWLTRMALVLGLSSVMESAKAPLKVSRLLIHGRTGGSYGDYSSRGLLGMGPSTTYICLSPGAFQVTDRRVTIDPAAVQRVEIERVTACLGDLVVVLRPYGRSESGWRFPREFPHEIEMASLGRG